MKEEELPYAGAIAIFDSGVGGLTVAAAVRDLVPGERIVYFGDSARVPYGTKSRTTIERFALENAAFLMRFSPRLIVVACNTASAVAVEALREALPVPVVGVVKPGARAAARVTRTGVVGVIGTETTIATDAYTRALGKIDLRIRVVSRACPLLVPLVEEGRTSSDPIVRRVVAEYLDTVKEANPDTLILGCTHYPLLREAICESMGPDVSIVDAACETAREVRRIVGESESPTDAARCFFLASDNPGRFAEIGSRFMGERIQKVFYVQPEEFFGSHPGVPGLG